MFTVCIEIFNQGLKNHTKNHLNIGSIHIWNLHIYTFFLHKISSITFNYF